MENISLLLSGECSRGLPYISFNSDENWDVTCTHLYQRTNRAEGQHVACVLQRRGGGARDSHEQGDVELDSNDCEILDHDACPYNRASIWMRREHNPRYRKGSVWYKVQYLIIIYIYIYTLSISK